MNKENLNGEPYIDFVIPWVDGEDPVWKEIKAHYKQDAKEDALSKWNDSDVRYRDWGLLRYWFRGVEEFAPWVRKVFFITCGQKPDWLNESHEKLVLVNHEDYIPKQWLPTFSSHCIELNLHRIDNLSEQFVYFNDDIFLVGKTDESCFFHKGKPKDAAIMKPVRMKQNGIRAEINDLYLINECFQMGDVIRKNPFKWINLKYGWKLGSTLLMLPYQTFSGFMISHLSIAYLKSSFNEVWERFPEALEQTCSHRFRKSTDVNQWLMQYWQFAKGVFYPRSLKIGKSFEGDQTIDDLCESIKAGDYKMICFNDSPDIIDFERRKTEIQQAFNAILPERSSFEKY